MGIIKNNKATLIAGLALFLLYFLFRLPQLTSLPIFTDEAIYLRWAQIASHDPSWTFISLTDGKQPLFIWASMVAMRFFDDPLLAGRLVSIVTGAMSMAGLWLVSYELFKSKKVAFLTSLTYIVSPFAQVYDRMAIMDSMSAAFYIWSIYFSVLLVRRVRLDIAFALGFAIGGGLLTKSSALFSIYLLPFTLVLINTRKNLKMNRILRWGAYALFAVLISQFFYGFLRLSPLFGMIDQKNQVFLYSFSEWLPHPFTYLYGNLRGLSGWFVEYMHLPLVVLIIGAIALIKEFTREKLLLLVYFFAPFIALALFAKVIYPRYIFFMALALYPLIGWMLGFIWDRSTELFAKKLPRNLSFIVPALIVALFLVYPAFISYTYIVDPAKADIPETDRGQYVTSWPSGAGVKEAVAYFNEISKDQKILVATQGTFGILPHALELYLYDNKNVSIKAFWPIENEFPQDVLAKSKELPTYFVFYEPCLPCRGTGVPPESWPLSSVLQVKKYNDINFGVYKVE